MTDDTKLQASQQAGSSVRSRCLHRAAVPLLSDKLFVVSESLAFTWGRRAQNASSEWNESKAKLVII